MKTCKHFRFTVPKEDADLLREQDNEPCEICDRLKKEDKKKTVKYLNSKQLVDSHSGNCNAL